MKIIPSALTRVIILFLLTTLPDIAWAQVRIGRKAVLQKCEPVGISKAGDYEEADYEPLLNALKSKDLVFLGEFTHGAKEIFETRNDLIRELHEQLGFNTVLFESGFGELLGLEYLFENGLDHRLTDGFFGNWRVREMQELMQYLKSRNMNIAGYDVQRSGDSFGTFFQAVAGTCGINDSIPSALEKSYVSVSRRLRNRKITYVDVQDTVQELIANYSSVARQMESCTANTESLPGVIRSLQNRIASLEYMLQWKKDSDWHRRWRARDSMMAENLRWLRKNRYPDEKMIVIGHNFHISRYNAKEEVMGEFLQEDYGDSSYLLGVFAGSGTYADNSGNPKSMQPPDTTVLDFKTIIDAAPAPLSFIDITDNTECNWLRSPIFFNDTFIDLSGTETLVLNKHFDGLLLLKTVTATTD